MEAQMAQTDLIAPFFEETEQDLFERVVGGQDLEELGLLALDISNASKLVDHVEEICCLYLLTNMVLMAKAKRRILKLVKLNESGDASAGIYPFLNSVRYYLADSFSDLARAEYWIERIESITPVSPKLKADILDITKFLRSAQFGNRGHGTQRAETLLSVEADGQVTGQGFALEFANPFVVGLKTPAGDMSYNLPQVSVLSGLTVRVSYQRDIVAFEIDGSRSDEVIENWVRCLESIYDQNMLGISSES